MNPPGAAKDIIVFNHGMRNRLPTPSGTAEDMIVATNLLFNQGMRNRLQMNPPGAAEDIIVATLAAVKLSPPISRDVAVQIGVISSIPIKA